MHYQQINPRNLAFNMQFRYKLYNALYDLFRRDVPVGVPLDLSTLMEWHELPKYNGIQVSQLIYDLLSAVRL